MTPFRTLKRLAWALVMSLGVPLGASAQDLDKMVQMERQDFGVQPTQQLHRGAMHGPTPASIPGGHVITTKGLVALVQGRQVPFILFDVLGQSETLPNAVPAAWLAQPGSFDDAVQQQAGPMLGQQTQGRKDVALVFYCLSRECWMSYNAALRAIHAGYKNVLWYRGGIEAWKMAGQPTQQGQQAAAQQQPGNRPSQQGATLPATFVPVKPVAREGGGGANVARPPAGELRIGQGRFFSLALPPGWHVGEDGQFALTLLSPDSSALTLMVGNAGFPLNHPPARFAYEKLSQMQLQNLQIGQPRQARPAAGFRQAVEFDVSYSRRGVAYRGVAKVSVSPAYDSSTMALTAALAPANQWVGYATWLPQVADQISATNGGAFGMRGIMQQNLQNSAAFGEAARQYRDWSQKNWSRSPTIATRARTGGTSPCARTSVGSRRSRIRMGQPAGGDADDAQILLAGSAGEHGRDRRSEREPEHGLERRMAQDGTGRTMINPASDRADRFNKGLTQITGEELAEAI